MRHRLFALLALCIAAEAGADNPLVNPNLADKASLEAVPFIDASLADALIAGRPYLTAAALDAALNGALDAEQREAVYASLFRPMNLNTANEAEIKLIPGMTNRMVHEFEEYRPYTSMEQFRREIGKYVDEDEVARFERYVFVPVNLNTASDDEIMAIPGMTRRMVHEFEEYRPYTSMEQFRREIGKYVDENEVARLESYVYLD